MTATSRASGYRPPSIIYIDMAYDLVELRRQGRLSFVSARNRGKLFDRVISIHPLAGLIDGAAAGRMRLLHLDSRNLVIDGFRGVPPGGRVRRTLNILVSQLRILMVVCRLARDPSVKLIAASDIFYLGLLAIVAGRLTGTPVTVAAYQNQDEIYENSGKLAFPRLLPTRWLEQRVQRFVLKRAQVIEAPTENMRSYLERNGAQSQRIRKLTVARTIDSHHMTPPDERPIPLSLFRTWSIDPMAPRMIMISRLIELKLVRDGLEAMIEACHRVPSAVALIFGEGELAVDLMHRIDEAGLSKRIVLAGKVDQRALAALARDSVAISPLTGMALVEASLAGSVPVAYDRDWQPEFVNDGVNGFIVPFGDITAMAQRAIQLLQDRTLFETMSAAARHAGKEFADPARVDQREAEVFAGICGLKRASSP